MFFGLDIHQTLWPLNWNKILSADYGINVHKNTPNHKMLSEGIVRQCVVHICLIVSGKLICFEHFRDKIDSYIDRMPQGLS